MITNAEDFLIDNLNHLSELFPEIHIRYEFRKNTNSHIIEVIPLSVFENSEDYIKAEVILEKQFEKLFPDGDIIFVSEDSLTKIKNAGYEFGKNQISFDPGILENSVISNGYNEEFNGNEINYAIAA